MTLLSEALAVLVVAALLTWRGRVRGAPMGMRSAAVVAVLAVLAFDAVSASWVTWQGFRNDRRANAAIPAADVATRPGASIGANVAFVEWLNGKLPPGAEFYLRSTGADEATYQWLTYRLYPRVAVQDASAHWLVFLGITPADAGYKRSEFSRVEQFAPGLLLAERRP
jgi:hypothetical protein